MILQEMLVISFVLESNAAQNDINFSATAYTCVMVLIWGPTRLKKKNYAPVNIAVENGPFKDVFQIKNGDIPLLC